MAGEEEETEFRQTYENTCPQAPERESPLIGRNREPPSPFQISLHKNSTQSCSVDMAGLQCTCCAGSTQQSGYT
eukprot:6195526-Pleurochrysis_carterae.AAC.1